MNKIREAENNEISAVEVAKRQRHYSLLKKVKENKPLTSTEMTELDKYELMAKKSKKKKVKKQKAVKKRLPVSAKRLKYYGFVCENIVEAENLCISRTPLAEIIEKYPQLKAAWERGRFLRDIKKEAENGLNLDEAAKLLKYKNVKEFKKMLESDYEAKSIWNSIRRDRI